MKLKTKNKTKSVVHHIILAFVAFCFAFPLFWMFMTSFKTPLEYYSMPPKLFPNQIHLFHYRTAFFPWTIDPNEMSESTYYIEESAGRVESVVPNIWNSLIKIGRAHV